MFRQRLAEAVTEVECGWMVALAILCVCFRSDPRLRLIDGNNRKTQR